MASLELYINQQLCDTENSEDFSVYLKRQLLNPAELSMKDAQRSYDITLPATAVNNEILGYINTEEVKGKFLQLYDAQLIMNGIKIFDGKFKISEIAKTYYKGNLGVPAQKTVKDIFDEKMMNEAGEWLIPFGESAKSITEYNRGEREESKYCFFPLVMYGLLPKYSKDGRYTGKTVLDDTMNFTLKDFPPSINCIEAMKHFFETNTPKLSLSGTALKDERLTNLFMSYKNPDSYVMPWNYGSLAKIKVQGNWTNYKSRDETEVNFNHSDDSDELKRIYNVDLMNGSNARVDVLAGMNEYVKKIPVTVHDRSYEKTVITIPERGLYKVVFDAEISLPENLNGFTDTATSSILSPSSFTMLHGLRKESFEINCYEIKVMRYNDDEIDLSSFGYDNTFYKNNQNQDAASEVIKAPLSGEVNFIDPEQNPDLLCGLSFGKHDINGNTHPKDVRNMYCNPIAIKNGKSWNSSNKIVRTSAVQGNGYYKLIKEDDLYEAIDEYSVNLKNSPENEIFRSDNLMKGTGKISQVVWFEQGEKITVTSNSKAGFSNSERRSGWVHYNTNFTLSIEAFRQEADWIQIDEHGNSTMDMDWNDDITFLTDTLDLSKFLPSNVKINDWIDNFCKAFNLDLVQTEADEFELNTKRQRDTNKTLIIDLDKKANVNFNRTNNSLNLPSAYEIGFKVDDEEQGFLEYKESGIEDTSNGRFETGSIENKTLKQTSSFSYNWFKPVTDIVNGGTMRYLPIISEKEPWEASLSDYEEMQEKYQKDRSQRFWYKKGETFQASFNKSERFEIALVQNNIEGTKPMNLDYKNEPGSILRNYFTLLTDVGNSYTIVECFLRPDEYVNIGESLVRFNGDLYSVASVDGYDPLCKKKATLKLIRLV